ncbi:hypothetical protein FUAX_11120 [Fulvitalea axinellae]|uniref:Uncharacterized protein n=1 Tax=Fulvitalea axinellae TaxID=1182444 RepID=A0AAU9DCV3_9BACT|nr:hypothetical protein FUAX_11120 [Fulvitalea axinellae]
MVTEGNLFSRSGNHFLYRFFQDQHILKIGITLDIVYADGISAHNHETFHHIA